MDAKLSRDKRVEMMKEIAEALREAAKTYDLLKANRTFGWEYWKKNQNIAEGLAAKVEQMQPRTDEVICELVEALENIIDVAMPDDWDDIEQTINNIKPISNKAKHFLAIKSND